MTSIITYGQNRTMEVLTHIKNTYFLDDLLRRKSLDVTSVGPFDHGLPLFDT